MRLALLGVVVLTLSGVAVSGCGADITEEKPLPGRTTPFMSGVAKACDAVYLEREERGEYVGSSNDCDDLTGWVWIVPRTDVGDKEYRYWYRDGLQFACYELYASQCDPDYLLADLYPNWAAKIQKAWEKRSGLDEVREILEGSK